MLRVKMLAREDIRMTGSAGTWFASTGVQARRAASTAFLVGLMILGGAGRGWAHKAPPNCSKTGPSLLLGEFFDTDGDGVGETPVNRAKIDGDVVCYQATLAFTILPPTQCAYFGGAVCIDPPGAQGCTDVTPAGGIPI